MFKAPRRHCKWDRQDLHLKGLPTWPYVTGARSSLVCLVFVFLYQASKLVQGTGIKCRGRNASRHLPGIALGHHPKPWLFSYSTWKSTRFFIHRFCYPNLALQDFIHGDLTLSIQSSQARSCSYHFPSCLSHTACLSHFNPQCPLQVGLTPPWSHRRPLCSVTLPCRPGITGSVC